MRRAFAILACVALLVVTTPRRVLATDGATSPAWEPAATWALLIGVLEWKSPGLGSFPKAGRVDRALERALYDRGVPRTQVTFLEDKQATLARCREALRTIATAAGPGSTLIVYYAGHGVRSGETTCFAPYDMNPKDVAGTGLRHDEIAHTLAGTWKGSRVLLLADCCESGGLGTVVRAYAGEGTAKAASLTSAMETHVSTSTWTFTASIVKVLSGDGHPDTDRDGMTTFDEADQFVRREMRWRERQLTSAQRSPSFEPGFVLARVRPADVKKRVPGPHQIGEYVEIDGNFGGRRGLVLDVAADGRVRFQPLGATAASAEWIEPRRIRLPTAIGVRPGDRVDINGGGGWWPGRVLETSAEFAWVRYDAWGPAYDEWVGAHRVRRRKAP